MTNSLTHFEIYGEQPAGLADFYRRVFGWQIEQMTAVDYWRMRCPVRPTRCLAG